MENSSSNNNLEIIPTEEISKMPGVKKHDSTLIKLDQNGKIDVSNLDATNLEKYKKISTSLKTNDTNSILSFGSELQNKLAGYSDQFLGNVRAFDAGEIGTSITDLLTEINYVDIDPDDNKGFKGILLKIPFVKHLVMNTKKIFQKYDSISGNIDGIIKKLEKGKIVILKDNAQLQALFEKNVEYIYELEDHLISGQLIYNDLEKELKDMEVHADQYQDYEISDKREFLSRLSKRLTDMQITRQISFQSLPQIRLVQNNNTTMVEKIQSSIITTIPLWKSQISIAVSLMRQKNIAEVQKKIYDTTNTILIKNAEMLKQNSIEIATQNEQTIVSMETLHTVNQKLIETLTEVKRIKEEGEVKRKDVAKQLETLEKDLKSNVLQLT